MLQHSQILRMPSTVTQCVHLVSNELPATGRALRLPHLHLLSSLHVSSPVHRSFPLVSRLRQPSISTIAFISSSAPVHFFGLTTFSALVVVDRQDLEAAVLASIPIALEVQLAAVAEPVVEVLAGS